MAKISPLLPLLALGIGAMAMSGGPKAATSQPSTGGGGGDGALEDDDDYWDDDPWEPDPEEPDDDGGFTPEDVPDPASYPILDRREFGEAKLPEDGYTKDGRDMSVVVGLVLHQTGFSRGSSDPSKYDKVAAHFIIMPNGQIIQTQELDRWMNSAGAFNRRTISVEFVGNFPSSRGKWYKGDKFGRHELSEEQIASGRFLVDYLIEELPKWGSPGLLFIYAHRQSYKTRTNDPGPDIWYNVGEWAKQERGLGPDDSYFASSGNPIPDEWTQGGGYAGRPQQRGVRASSLALRKSGYAGHPLLAVLHLLEALPTPPGGSRQTRSFRH